MNASSADRTDEADRHQAGEGRSGHRSLEVGIARGGAPRSNDECDGTRDDQPDDKPDDRPGRAPEAGQVAEEQADDRSERRADGQDRQRRPAADRGLEQPHPAGARDARPDGELGEVVARSLPHADDEDDQRQPADRREPQVLDRLARATSGRPPPRDREGDPERADAARDEERVPLAEVRGDLLHVDEGGRARLEGAREDQRQGDRPHDRDDEPRARSGVGRPDRAARRLRRVLGTGDATGDDPGHAEPEQGDADHGSVQSGVPSR